MISRYHRSASIRLCKRWKRVMCDACSVALALGRCVWAGVNCGRPSVALSANIGRHVDARQICHQRRPWGQRNGGAWVGCSLGLVLHPSSGSSSFWAGFTLGASHRLPCWRPAWLGVWPLLPFVSRSPLDFVMGAQVPTIVFRVTGESTKCNGLIGVGMLPRCRAREPYSGGIGCGCG